MRRGAPRLRLVPEVVEPSALVGDGEQLRLFSESSTSEFVGLVDLARLSDLQFVEMLKVHRPRFVFDARVAPSLNIGRLYRRDVFGLFAAVGATYLYAFPRGIGGLAQDTGDEISHVLIREWSAAGDRRGVAIVLLPETVKVRDVRQAIRQQFTLQGQRAPSIRFLTPE